MTENMEIFFFKNFSQSSSTGVAALVHKARKGLVKVQMLDTGGGGGDGWKGEWKRGVWKR